MKKDLENKFHLIIYFIFLLFAFWISYIIIYGNGGIIKRGKIGRDLQILEAEIYELGKEKKMLKWEIKNLRSNKSYIEAFARELGYKREGEVIFKFVKKKKQ